MLLQGSSQGHYYEGSRRMRFTENLRNFKAQILHSQLQVHARSPEIVNLAPPIPETLHNLNPETQVPEPTEVSEA